MFTCPECGVATEGTIGIASGVLTSLCPPCRKGADNAALNEARTYAYMMEQIFEAVDPTPLTTTEIQ